MTATVIINTTTAVIITLRTMVVAVDVVLETEHLLSLPHHTTTTPTSTSNCNCNPHTSTRKETWALSTR